MSKSTFEAQPEDARVRLDIFLSKKTSKTRAFIQDLIKNDKVLVNHQLEKKASTLVRPGDQISVDWEENHQLSSFAPVPGDLSILFEDSHLLVLNKRQGVVVHPAAGHRGDTLVHHLLHHWDQPALTFSDASPATLRPGIVHRLDKGTSGVLLVAKNRETQDALSFQFKERTVEKTYQCIVWGQVSRPGKLTSSIGRDKKHRHKMSSHTHQGRPSETSFSPLESFNQFTHLAAFPKTGRTHQIRVHLSEWGHPIVGDPLYGKGLTTKRKSELSSEIITLLTETPYPFLHASSLIFTHPVSNERLKFIAPLPPIFTQFLELLRCRQ